jgi:membrane-associated protease RseP (regulator of RpoE activity)
VNHGSQLRRIEDSKMGDPAMRTTQRLLVSALLFGAALTTTHGVLAQGVTTPGGVKTRMVVPGASPYLVQGGYFSKRLGAQFVIQTIQIGNFPAVKAARITSQPRPGSPLEQLGLEIGDVITRLDGIPVTKKTELENHIQETQVRFVKTGTHWVQQGWMFVHPHQYFHEAQYPPIYPFPGNPFPQDDNVLSP